MDRWSGGVALVTGASAGIGAAICRELVKHGLTVVGCARNVHRMQEISQEEDVCSSSGSLVPIRCDLTKEDEILSMFDVIRERFGHLDICINNAGLCFDCPLLTGRTDQWRTMIDVNVLALCICTREAFKLMKESKREAQIIHLSSMSAYRIPDLAIHMYGGTKYMLKALTEGHRRELFEYPNIRVASISPGNVETEFEYRCYPDDPAKADEIYNSMKCLEAKDIAESVLYILRSPPHVQVHDILIRPREQKM